MSIKQQIANQWGEWMTFIAGILGPLTSLIFEDKYTPKQIFTRLVVGAVCAMFLGSYFSEHVESPNLKALLIYMCGFGGYYILKGLLKVFELFGIDPVKGINYVWVIIRSARPTITQKNKDENNTENPGGGTSN